MVWTSVSGCGGWSMEFAPGRRCATTRKPVPNINEMARAVATRARNCGDRAHPPELAEFVTLENLATGLEDGASLVAAPDRGRAAGGRPAAHDGG
jgi:hypothetical protein